MSQVGPLPQLGGAVEEMVHERASATPSQAAPLPTHDHTTDERVAPLTASVAELQRWFLAAVCHPGSVQEGILASPLLPDASALAGVLTHGPQLDALHRLGVYHFSYRARLIECLADDYPALQFALGEAPFEALCSAYIVQHPSTAPSLNFFGRHMASFCRSDASGLDPAQRVFCANLASLEWSLVEVLHSPEAPTLSQSELSRIPPERWSEARLPASEAARLLRFDYPVNTYFQAWRTDAPIDWPAPTPSATAVYRQGYTLWRMDLTPTMTDLLERLFAGVSLGDALGAIPTPDDEAEATALEQSVMRWFGEWVSGGLFGGVFLPG